MHLCNALVCQVDNHHKEAVGKMGFVKVTRHRDIDLCPHNKGLVIRRLLEVNSTRTIQECVCVWKQLIPVFFSSFTDDVEFNPEEVTGPAGESLT